MILQHFDSERISLGDKKVHPLFLTQKLTMPDFDWYLIQLKLILSGATAASAPISNLCRPQPARHTRTDTENKNGVMTVLKKPSSQPFQTLGVARPHLLRCMVNSIGKSGAGEEGSGRPKGMA